MKLIYDIGMHVGQDTKNYLEQGYRVLAVEANPFLVEEAERKFAKYIHTKQLTILNIGIAKTESVLPFYRNLRLSEWSSFDKSSGTRNGTKFEVIDVPCTTTRQLFDTYGIPYYLKVDIEGNDHLCISDIPEGPEKPLFVSCEAGSIEWLDILYSKGYTKFKMISQLDNHSEIDLAKESKRYYPYYQIIRNGIKLRLQKLIPFKDMYGSSGPFGDKTKGSWRTYQEVKELYEGFFFKGLHKPLNHVSWFDFHATF